MQRISLASEKDLDALQFCFRRVCVDLEYQDFPPFSSAYPSSDSFLGLIDDGQVTLLKEGARVKGAVMATSLVGEALFPKTQSEKKINELLELISFRGEAIKVLRLFFVDPSIIGKGEGKTFLTSFLRMNPETSWFTYVQKENGRAISFLRKLGFVPLPFALDELGEDLLVYAKPFRKSGLCSEAYW